MNGVNKTLYIPLYGKAYVSRKGLFLQDKKAEEIWAAEGFLLKGKSKSKWLAYYLGIRSAVFDKWLRKKMSEAEDAVILHVGCGLDSRVLRVGTNGHLWYDVDFQEVIKERSRYFSESEEYRMIQGDIRSAEWLNDLPKDRPLIVVMEGVSMYLTNEERKKFLQELKIHFSKVSLLMDCYTMLAAKLSRYKNPINEVGATSVYGLDDPHQLESDHFLLKQEHEMTPTEVIDQLRGMEKMIFQKLYAGSTSKKLYRLYEYESK